MSRNVPYSVTGSAGTMELAGPSAGFGEGESFPSTPTCQDTFKVRLNRNGLDNRCVCVCMCVCVRTIQNTHVYWDSYAHRLVSFCVYIAGDAGLLKCFALCLIVLGGSFPQLGLGFFFPRPARYLTHTGRLKSICAQSPAQCAARRILRLPRCHCPERRRTDRSLRLTHNLLGSRLLFSLVSGTPQGSKDRRSVWMGS